MKKKKKKKRKKGDNSRSYLKAEKKRGLLPQNAHSQQNVLKQICVNLNSRPEQTKKKCKKFLIVGRWLWRGCATGMGGPAAAAPISTG
jgi:hypothetical protein